MINFLVDDSNLHLMTTKNNNDKDLLEIFRLIKNYR